MKSGTPKPSARNMKFEPKENGKTSSETAAAKPITKPMGILAATRSVAGRDNRLSGTIKGAHNQGDWSGSVVAGKIRN